MGVYRNLTLREAIERYTREFGREPNYALRRGELVFVDLTAEAMVNVPLADWPAEPGA